MKYMFLLPIFISFAHAARVRRAGHVGGRHYSTDFGNAVTANEAKINAAAQALDANLMTTIVSLDASATAMSGLETYFEEQTTQTDMDKCYDAFEGSLTLRIPILGPVAVEGGGSPFNILMSEVSFSYAFGYMTAAQWADFKTAIKACMTALATPTETADQLDAGMAAVKMYPGRIAMDWTKYSKAKADASPAITLQGTDAMDYFTGLKLEFLTLYSYTVYHDYTVLAPPTDAIATINALSDTWNFANYQAYLDAFEMNQKLDVLGYTNTLDLFVVTHGEAIEAALGYTATSTPTQAENRAAFTAFEALKTEFGKEIVLAEANYNSAGKLAFGLVLVMVSIFMV